MQMSFPRAMRPMPVAGLARLSGFALASLVGCFYAGMAPRFNPELFYDRLLFGHNKCDQLQTTWFGRAAREVRFSGSGGRRLSGLFFPAENASRVVLVHHGSGQNLLAHVANLKFMLKAPVALLIYDYAGFGKSEGAPSIKGLAQDARSAYKYLIEKEKIAPDRIVHYGASLGSGPAVLMAAEAPCAGLVLFAPYTCLREAARERFAYLKYYPDFLLSDWDFNSESAIARVRAPIFIAHGARDATLSVRFGDRLFAAATAVKEYMRIADAGHTQFTAPEQPARMIRFIESL